MSRMYNPPHPGEILSGLHMQPAGLAIADVAVRLGVDRKTLSRLINCHTSVSTDMALRLSRVFNTTPELWLKLQTSYDLWKAAQDKTFRAKLKTLVPITEEVLETH